MIFLRLIVVLLTGSGVIPLIEVVRAAERQEDRSHAGAWERVFPGSPGFPSRNRQVISVAFQNDLDQTANQIKAALREGKYPWYDSRTDRVRPVWPVRISWLEWLGERVQSFLRRIGRSLDRFHFGGDVSSSVGNSIGTILLLAALVAFLVCIFMLWVGREKGLARSEADRNRLGTAARLGDLPEGLRPADADPWAEAKRRRAAGDFAGAVICLFAHQLLTLDQMGLIRLAPGRTGRHYLLGLRDRELIDSVGATLRLFEDVYYGRKSPSLEAFELVWSRAQLFQERQQTLAARVSP